MRIIAGTMLVLLGALPAPARQAQDSDKDPWQPFAFFLGRWVGRENATFGSGTGERTYRLVLGGRYLLSENKSTFEPQPGLPTGDRHEDWTFFSYDQTRKTYIVRQFNSEGFVNLFALDPSSTVPTKMVFVSEASENAPPDLWARLTYERTGDNQFNETFEVGTRGKAPDMVIRNVWTRAP